MTLTYLRTLGFALCAIAYSNQTFASDDASLFGACDHFKKEPSSLIGYNCYSFVSGFIDGALLTDAAIVTTLADEKQKDSEFFNRAYRTRIGELGKNAPATYLAEFCLPAKLDRQALVEQIVTLMPATQPQGQSFAETLYMSIKKQFPCG